MAVAFETISAVATSSGTTITIDKPSGLSVGDLMVAVFGSVDNSGSGETWAEKTGWRRLFTDVAENDVSMSVQVKIADSSDVAASNFAFTSGSGSSENKGVIYRISGSTVNVSDITFSNNGPAESNFSSATTGTVTPVTGNCLLILSVISQSNGQGYSGYAIATSNPTWTERVDSTTSTQTIAGATASRPEVTATGTGSMTPAVTGSGTSEYVAALIVIPPPVNGSATPDAVGIEVSVPTPSIAYGGSASPNAVAVQIDVPSPTVSTKDNPWTNQDKNDPSTWTNQDKS